MTIIVKVSEWHENGHNGATTKAIHFYYALAENGSYKKATPKQEAGFSFGERIEFVKLDYPIIGKNANFSPLTIQDHAEAHEVSSQAIAKGWRVKQKFERDREDMY